MSILQKLKAIPNGQKFRYSLMFVSCLTFLSPLLILPGLADNPDLCGKLCMRRFYLYFPGMSWQDLLGQVSVAWIGAFALLSIFICTFFFGRMWCSHICPVGAVPELVSRTLNDHWKLEFRSLPQVPIRYGYFGFYIVGMPMLGISACTLCNFITVPRIFEAFAGGLMGFSFIFSTVGVVNLALLFLLGFFSSKGRAYCQLLCPIGAMDGLINRIGARFRFTRHIRVERDRCTGCNICARKCMCGAIKMVDRIAVVDQHSCMSCYECVNVCDWDAIDWLPAPKGLPPKRIKKGIEIYPQPLWKAHHVPKAEVSRWSTQWHSISWRRVSLLTIFFVLLMFITLTQVYASPRSSDPDGCMSCHSIAGLDYVDENGLYRSASINNSHYLGSLHGSVPCKDCHRKVVDYPHEVKNTEVDCAESCHLEEPSGGEPYTHKPVVDEFSTSIHGKGWSDGFTGANRLAETYEQQLPSCRKCHSNDAYISLEESPVFKEVFAHVDIECGSCHQGKVWRGQFGGHILRRLMDSGVSKHTHNQLCNDCHADRQRMADSDRQDSEGRVDNATDERFVQASHSYKMTLHSRLIDSGVEEGASCIDCHTKANSGFSHDIFASSNPLSATHKKNLIMSCGSDGCHSYAADPFNKGFLHTDMHDVDMIAINRLDFSMLRSRLGSNWSKAIMALLPILVIIGLGSVYFWFFGDKSRKVVVARFGGEHFNRQMIGRAKKTIRIAKKTKAATP